MLIAYHQFALQFAYHGFTYCDWLIMRTCLPVFYCLSDQFTSPIYSRPPLDRNLNFNVLVLKLI